MAEHVILAEYTVTVRVCIEVEDPDDAHRQLDDIGIEFDVWADREADVEVTAAKLLDEYTVLSSPAAARTNG